MKIAAGMAPKAKCTRTRCSVAKARPTSSPPQSTRPHDHANVINIVARSDFGSPAGR